MSSARDTRNVVLADGRVDPPVPIPAVALIGMTGDRLVEVEAVWSPAREELATAIQTAGGYLKSGHWNWRNKAGRVERGELVLCTVECEEQVQGLMAVSARPHPAVLGRLEGGKEVTYIDCLETAPWNLRAPCTHPG